MATATRFQPYTSEDFGVLVKDGQKADLINGAIYLASPDNTVANELFVWTSGLMYDYSQFKDLGKVYGSRVAFRLSNVTSPEPDIGFVRKSRLKLVKRGRVEGAPDLAVEIVSPDSIERDYVTKRQLFQEAGIREYWIVDETKQKVTLLRLGPGGKYREVRPRKEALYSEALAGFWLRPEWLWQRPLPVKVNVLGEILGASE